LWLKAAFKMTERQSMSNVDRWVQITTAVSILIGLGLVIWELQQVKTLARAQLTSDSIAIYNDIRTAVLGEQASHVIAKACLNPESLTPSETVVAHQYYLAQANLLSRLAIHTDRDGVYPAGYWQEQMWYLNPILESQYGRDWLLRRTGFPAGFLEEVHSLIKGLEPPACALEFQNAAGAD
jgi:hypothetical protein